MNTKFKYAPGLPGYGTQGDDGEDGLTGLSFYFSDLDGNNQTSNYYIINVKLFENRYLYSNNNDLLPNNRAYQDGDLFVDKNGIIYEIKPAGVVWGPEGTSYYRPSGYILNIASYFSLAGITDLAGSYNRVINTVDNASSVKYLIDNIYPKLSTPISSYVLKPTNIYSNVPVDYGQIKFVDFEKNSKNPFVIYSAGVNDNNAFAISRDLNNTFRIGNLDSNNVLRDVSLALDFKSVLWNIPNVTFQEDNSINVKFEKKITSIFGQPVNPILGNSFSLTAQEINVNAINLDNYVESFGGDVILEGGYNLTTAPDYNGNLIKGGNLYLKGGSTKAWITSGTNEYNILGGDVLIYGGKYSYSEFASNSGGSTPDNVSYTLYAKVAQSGNVYLGLTSNYQKIGKVLNSEYSYMIYNSSEYKLLSAYNLNPTHLFNHSFNPSPIGNYWNWDSSGNEITINWDKKGFFGNYTNAAQVQANLVLYKDVSIKDRRIMYSASTGKYTYENDVSAFNPIILHNLEPSGTVTITGLEYYGAYNSYIEFVERGTATSDVSSNGWIRRSQELDMRTDGNSIPYLYFNFINNSSNNIYTFLGTISDGIDHTPVLYSSTWVMAACDDVYWQFNTIPFRDTYDISIWAQTGAGTPIHKKINQTYEYLRANRYIQFALNKEEDDISIKFFNQLSDFEDASTCCGIPINLLFNDDENIYAYLVQTDIFTLSSNKLLSSSVGYEQVCEHSSYLKPNGTLYFDVSIYVMGINGGDLVTIDNLDISIWAYSSLLSPSNTLQILPTKTYNETIYGTQTTVLESIFSVSSTLTGTPSVDDDLYVYVSIDKGAIYTITNSNYGTVTTNIDTIAEISLRSDSSTFNIPSTINCKFKGGIKIPIRTADS
jgi:hypothetical protein